MVLPFKPSPVQIDTLKALNSGEILYQRRNKAGNLTDWRLSSGQCVTRRTAARLVANGLVVDHGTTIRISATGRQALRLMEG